MFISKEKLKKYDIDMVETETGFEIHSSNNDAFDHAQRFLKDYDYSPEAHDVALAGVIRALNRATMLEIID